MHRRTVKSAAEFDSLMREIDSAMKEKNVALHARQFHALSEAAKILNVKLIGGPLRTGPIPDVFEGESLSAHIFAWIKDRYGDRLKIDFSTGYSVLLLKGDPWLLRFPIVFGEITIICDRDLSKKYEAIGVSRLRETANKPTMNLLSCIESLPQGLAAELSDNELIGIMSYYLHGHEFLNNLTSFYRDNELAAAALADLTASAKYCVSGVQSYGFSRWSSLQAAEKFLKHFIKTKGCDFAHTHDLKKLCQKARKAGLPLIEDDFLSRVQCSADVRYESGTHTLVDVHAAHTGALSIGALAMRTLHPT